MAQRAPFITGYNWSRHSNAMMFVLPEKSCNCGESPIERVREGLQHGLDIVVVAPTSAQELEALRQAKFPPHRFFLHTDTDLSIVHNFSPKEQVANVRIKNGRIVASSTGALPEEFFH